jgi:hypothetical protein
MREKPVQGRVVASEDHQPTAARRPHGTHQPPDRLDIGGAKAVDCEGGEGVSAIGTRRMNDRIAALQQGAELVIAAGVRIERNAGDTRRHLPVRGGLQPDGNNVVPPFQKFNAGEVAEEPRPANHDNTQPYPPDSDLQRCFSLQPKDQASAK